MFKKQCPFPEPHARHQHTVHWYLKDLLFLPNTEAYPAEWDSVYVCDGIPAEEFCSECSALWQGPEFAPYAQHRITCSKRVA